MKKYITVENKLYEGEQVIELLKINDEVFVTKEEQLLLAKHNIDSSLNELLNDFEEYKLK